MIVARPLLRRSRALVRAALCTAALAGACAPPAAVPPRSGPVVAFVGVHVVSMAPGAGVARDQTVLVEGSTIRAIGPANRLRVPEGAQRVDGAGKYLLPGLADMHVHLEYFQDPEVLKLFVARGVTTVRNMDGRPHILQWRRGTAAGELLGPTIYTAGPILDGSPPMIPDNQVVRGPAEARAAVLAQDSAGYDFIKVYTGLSPESYRAVLATARERKLPVAGHLPRDMDAEEAIGLGVRAVEHLTDYGELMEAEDSPLRGRWHWSRLFTAVLADSARAARAAEGIARAGVWTVPTLVERARAIAPPDSLRAWLAAPELAAIPAEMRTQWEAQLRRGTARMDSADWVLIARGRANRGMMLRALHRAGAGLAAGTDTPNPFVVPGASLVEELERWVEAGLTPTDALAAATRDAARLMGAGREWGTIEAGKRADLVLVAGNPLENVGYLSRPDGVMLRGRWLAAAELDAMLASVRLR